MLSLKFENGTFMEWNPGDDGGGSTHYIDFLNAIPKNSKFKKCLEWCAGCSAISFSLLDANIVEELVLLDVYKPALEQALLNAKNNNFTKVKAYNIDCISKLPIDEKFDLVVSNPPHTVDFSFFEQMDATNFTEKEISDIERLTVDKNWKIHQEFFSNISKYLNPGAEIYISESNQYTSHVDWAKEAGLILKKVYPASLNDTNLVILHFIYEEKIH